MIVPKDLGGIGRKRNIPLLGRLADTCCGGPARHHMSGLEDQIRTAEDLSAVVCQAVAEIGGSSRITG